ncbi:hypothetical protein L4D08_24525 [Photobacterium chitinilyticum]|uniref:hypothetical protein n=1 Tax=Photobacterium chitinilyticum TaxID=2485123 RepID=UPI003D0A1C65
MNGESFTQTDKISPESLPVLFVTDAEYRALTRNASVSVLERIEINHFVVPAAHGPSTEFHAPITNKRFNIEFAGSFGHCFAAGMQVRDAKKCGFITAVTVNGIALRTSDDA